MNNVLEGRIAIVTGAGSGIGRGISLALAAAGAKVVVTARRRSTGDETLALIEKEGGTAISLEMDVSVYSDVEKTVAAAVDRFGGLDIMVHNANNSASALPIKLEDVTEADWDAQAKVSVGGGFHCARAAFPYLKNHGRGRFISLCSCFGLHGAAMNPIYSTLKGGERGFTKALAREWGPYGITVNAISPAGATEPTVLFFSQNPAVEERYLANFPLCRMGRPREDIGASIVAICSDDFGYITAQTIQVDGGLYTAL